jgi:hypothetical protein
MNFKIKQDNRKYSPLMPIHHSTNNPHSYEYLQK